MTPTTLLLGSRGNVGRVLHERLLSLGHTVRTTHRPGTTPASPHSLPFDYTAPNTFAAALSGIDQVFLLSPPGHADAYTLITPFLEAATSSPRKFVLMTAYGIEHNPAAPLRRLELALESSGHPYVFLRPNWFMDNFHTFWLPLLTNKSDGTPSTLTLPAGEAATSLISARDIAYAAAAALTTTRFDGQAFPLTGPESITYTEAAAILSHQAGRTIRYEPTTDEQFHGWLLTAGLPADYADLLVHLFRVVRAGAAAPVTNAVEHLTGQAPETLHTYAARHASHWR